MLSLDATTKSLEVKLAGAVSTTQLPIVASYVDVNQSTFAQTASSEADTATNSGTAVTVVAAPAATTTRKLNYLSIFNIDTAAAVVTVQVNNNATLRISWKGTLAVGDTLFYVDGVGFRVTDSNGSSKTVMGLTSLTTGISGILPPVNGGTGVANNAANTLTFTGAYSLGLTLSGATALTLPTSGTVMTLAGGQTITNAVWNAGAVTATAVNAAVNIAPATGTARSYLRIANTGGDLQVGLEGSAGGQFFTGGGVYAGIIGTQNATALQFGTNGTVRAQINTNGTQTWSVYGAGAATFDASGNITSVSDERMKDIQGSFTSGLNAILGIRPILYKYNIKSGLDLENVYAGFSAQNVMKYIPEAIGKGPDEYYTFNPIPVLAAAVVAIQELTIEIDELRSAAKLNAKSRANTIVLNELRIIVSKQRTKLN